MAQCTPSVHLETTPPPGEGGSTFSAHQKAWGACWIVPFPGPSFNFWQFFYSGLCDEQIIPRRQLLPKTNWGVQPPTGAFPSSLPQPPFPACQSPLSTPATTLPEAPPEAAPNLSIHIHEA